MLKVTSMSQGQKETLSGTTVLSFQGFKPCSCQILLGASITLRRGGTFFFLQTWGPRYVDHLDQANAWAYPFFSSDSCTPQLVANISQQWDFHFIDKYVSGIGEGKLGTQLCTERESWGHSSALPSIVFRGRRGSSLESLQLLKLEFSAITEKNSMPSQSESELEVRIYHQ